MARTTRNVAPTEAGERLTASLRLAFQEIDGALATLGGMRDKPAGTVRITTSRHAADTTLILRAAVAGFGLACVMEDQAADLTADGRLVRALADWRPPFPGHHLYCPSRRQPTPAFTLLVEALRHRLAGL